MSFTHKTGKILFGILIIAVAVFLLLESFGVISASGILSIPFWKLGLSLLLVWQMINELRHMRVYGIFFPLAIIALILEKEISAWMGLADGYIGSTGLILLIALLLTVGFSILIPRSWLVRHLGRKGKNKNDYLRGEWNTHNTHLGSKTVYIDAGKNFYENVGVNLGSAAVYFTNTEAYPGGGVVNLDVNLGSITLYLPTDWTVESKIDNNLGSVSIEESGAADPSKVLLLVGDNNLGTISVKYSGSN